MRGALGARTCGELLEARGLLVALFSRTQAGFLLHAALGLGHTRHAEGPAEGEVGRKGISCEVRQRRGWRRPEGGGGRARSPPLCPPRLLCSPLPPAAHLPAHRRPCGAGVLAA